MPLRLFISHASSDKAIADALQSLIAEVFPPGPAQTVKIDYSSDDAPGGGIAPGARWLEWILEKVREADVCFVLLTADSVSAPWLTWEAGAVTGVAIATASATTAAAHKATVIPLLFGIGPDDIPAPLRHQQAVNGGQVNEVLQLVDELHRLGPNAEQFLAEAARPRVARFIRDVRRELQKRSVERPVPLKLPGTLALVHFVNGQSRFVLETPTAGTENHTIVQVGRFTGEARQGWLLYPVAKGVYRIVTSNRTKCLSVQNDSTKSGAMIILWDYEKHESQHWHLIRNVDSTDSRGTVRIINAASKLWLMPDPDTRQVKQTGIGKYADEDWWLLAAPDLLFI